ncbi:hypothetical protein H9Q09_13640 [Aurantimonas sp. DM33-3]|uniref:hypothetical protein n=1 Tax=Aurantimonas sp. DM33-3 TaxID=2766955 RepID=UPI00165252D6|nr:hypothetical protein [Aurantimonas sp. DM33-3]MBC6717251.1 hypothetical protein [Aurantimonas sp. DM33-3]
MAMLPLSVIRPFAIVLALLPAAACQSENTSVGALRLAASPDVPSSQRTDADGYPLLGAYPGRAAEQLTDAEVQAEQARLAATAGQHASAAAQPSGFDGKIQRAQSVRQQQAAEMEAVLATEPTPRDATGNRPARTGPTPEEVLRQIEAGQ